MSIIEFPGKRGSGTSGPPKLERSPEGVETKGKSAKEVIPGIEAQKTIVAEYLERIMKFRNDVSDLADQVKIKAPEDDGLRDIRADLERIADTLHTTLLEVTAAATFDGLNDVLSRAHACGEMLSRSFTSFVRNFGTHVSHNSEDEKVALIGTARHSDILARLLVEQPGLHDRPQIPSNA